MIVRETDSEYVMIPQHEHAQLSGMIGSHFSQEVMKYQAFLEDFKLAVFEHDRSWIWLDETPIWNDRAKRPFSFMDYPLLPKLALYEKGLHEIERMSPFACLLCSLHYSSFFKGTTQQECIGFITKEHGRQEIIKEELQIMDLDMINHYVRLLQFCDRLSLYVCLNHPGTDKDQEHPWYKDGFPHSDLFSTDRKIVKAEWNKQDQIIVRSFPFEAEFSATLRQKRVPKNLMQQLGVGEAYKQTEFVSQNVTFCE
ncbi:DUF3891 family protein [Marinicrinis lubricantis]|uniref:DUF3891 family protein n=1 Tax=Marinicrinis lubricantis TaxID=2086470 RepID=A0ABW1IK12_9BACL